MDDDTSTDGGAVADAHPAASLASDPVLADLVAEHGHLDLEPAADPFRRLVVAIVNQQLSTASAAAIRERLFDAYDITPEALLEADEAVLRDVGLSGQKVDYLRSVATHFGEGRVSVQDLRAAGNDEVVDRLTDIRGVGDWTAKMFLIFCLAREDVFPVEDLGVRRGLEAVVDEELSRPEMVERAEAWRPYRSYASLYLWRAHD